MMRPPGFTGAAFGAAVDGDGRSDPAARSRISSELGIPGRWAWLRQVHGRAVLRAASPGDQGEGDALYTSTPNVPVTVATADCVPIIIEGPDVAAVVHAGWRGAAAGVIPATLDAIVAAGLRAERAAVGPAIGPCCYEVGPEVAAAFPGFVAETQGGALAVDLPAVAASQLAPLGLWQSDSCTLCGDGLLSYRRDWTERRQVAVAWLPNG